MKVSVLKDTGLTKEIEVTVPAGDIARTMERELVEYGKRVKVDGFRKGKIPMQVLKSKYGKMILGEVLDKSIQEATTKVIQEQERRHSLKC